MQQTTLVNPTVMKTDKKKKLKRCLFLHTIHEKRLGRLRRDIHEAYQKTFTGPTINRVKLIVGNYNNTKAKSEFIRRKRPHIKFRRHDYKSSQYKHLICHSYTFMSNIILIIKLRTGTSSKTYDNVINTSKSCIS